MKKYLLPVLIFSIISLVFLTTQQLAFAAKISNETFTWNGDKIHVTGSDLQSATDLSVPGVATSFLFPGTLTIKDPQSAKGDCVVIINDIKVVGQNSITLVASNSLSTTPVANACPASIISAFNNKTVPVKGTPPNNPKGLKKVTVTVNVQGSTPPGSVTFTVGNQTQTGKRINAGVGFSYMVTFYLDPGNYQVCAAPILSCKSFVKKKNIPLDLTYGKIAPIGVPKKLTKDSIFVDILVSLVCDTKSVQMTLKQNGKVIQTVIGVKAAKTTLPGDKNVSNEVSAEFTKVPPGDYSICITSASKGSACDQSQDVTKVAGTAGNVVFEDQATAGVGVGQAAVNLCPVDAGLLPAPPLPPCAKWTNGNKGGVCESFVSAFGNFPTDPEAFIQKIFAILLSISGGIALLLIIKAGYQLMISQGKPEQIQQARDQLIAAIVGLIFLIFSFVFLQLIGFNILHIPGFTEGTSNSCGAGLQYCSSINKCYPASSTCP